MLSLWYEKVGGHLTHFIQISAKSGWARAHCAHPARTPLWIENKERTNSFTKIYSAAKIFVTWNSTTVTILSKIVIKAGRMLWSKLEFKDSLSRKEILLVLILKSNLTCFEETAVWKSTTFTTLSNIVIKAGRTLWSKPEFEDSFRKKEIPPVFWSNFWPALKRPQCKIPQQSPLYRILWSKPEFKDSLRPWRVQSQFLQPPYQLQQRQLPNQQRKN